MLKSQSWAIRRVAQAEVAVIFGSAYGKAAIAAPANSAFRSTGIWTVNRYVLQDHHFFPSVANTPAADFEHPVHGESQDDARASQASSQRTRNGNTYLLVPVEKISPLSVLKKKKKKSTGPKCLRGRKTSTFSPYMSARQVTRIRNRYSQNSPGNLRQKQNGVTIGSVKYARGFRRTA